jgi:U3 small nucleolar RNA-associated protein 21
MQLWNIRSQSVFDNVIKLSLCLTITFRTCVHKFSPASLLTSPSGSQDGSPVAITSLAQSPAIDVVGIGFASGEVSVYDVRMDERLLRMKMQDGAVRALSFRTGMSLCSMRPRFAYSSLDGHPILASASSNGHIALWDLNAGGRLLHIVRGAHDGAVTAVQWVSGQPLLISSGEDNSVKVCISSQN